MRTFAALLAISLPLATQSAAEPHARPASISEQSWQAAIALIPSQHQKSRVIRAEYFPPPAEGCRARPALPPSPKLEQLLQALGPVKCGLVILLDFDPHPTYISERFYRFENDGIRWHLRASGSGWQANCG